MILDTCALLWLAEGSTHRISTSTLNAINNAKNVYISAISGFEICIKVKSGKLRLPLEPQPWLDVVLKFHDIEVIPLSIDVCMFAAGLPAIHKDPCDRFIIATALTHALPVVTADNNFAGYGVEVLS
jgi:PIN domain nuclease of toxin-antitoxin system